MNSEENSTLGKKVAYSDQYDASLLFPIPRAESRKKIPCCVPKMNGYDVWNAYELSWIERGGCPCAATASFIIPSESLNIIESKSMKMYLNSFNNTELESAGPEGNYELLRKIIYRDFREACGSDNITISINNILRGEDTVGNPIRKATCLEYVCNPVGDFVYEVDPTLLKVYEAVDAPIVEANVYTNLLRSNCPVTGQPDWATVRVKYKGHQIDEDSLLRYFISYRNHNDFHESCIERIYTDIMTYARPEELFVEGRYTRRGGIDINPTRYSLSGYHWVFDEFPNKKLVRQ